jgi:uncharacterized protein (TIGR00255 family)
MIKGMTGFGAAALSHGAIKGIVEIKSVNHRYLDFAYYLPIGFGSVEGKIKQLVGKDIQRGRVTVAIKLTQKPTHVMRFNHDVVEAYIKEVKVLKKKFNLSDGLSVSEVIRLPGVVDVEDAFIQADTLWPSLEKSLKRALAALMTMRRREGAALRRDVSDKIRRMGMQARAIENRAKKILEEKKKSLGNDEFSSFQRGIDINEELSRLQHYLVEVKNLMSNKQPVGKKVDFIAQEMQRETNTIGSKMQDNVVSNAVIAMKSKIEKIREQAQNIE